MSSESEIVDVLSRVANIFLKAVDALETRMMMIDQRIDELERYMGGSRVAQSAPPAASYGGREQPAAQYQTPMPQQTRIHAPVPSTQASMPQPTPRTEAYGNPQAQWGNPRQDNYSQPAPQGYQARPQPPGYQQQGYQQQGPMQSQQPGAAPGPRPPSSPLNIRQAVTGELKDVFAKMRARAEGR